MIKVTFLITTGFLLSPGIQAEGFVLQKSFSKFLSQQFSNLTQFKNQTSSLQKKLAAQNALRGLLTIVAPHIEALSGYRKPFSSNCSVFFDAEIDQVACDAKFEEVQIASDSCKAEQQFPVSYLAQLHKSNILQVQTVVGLDPVQHPQVMYWLYYKLPPTPTVSLTETDTHDLSLTDSLSHTSGLTSTLTASESHTTTPFESNSHSLSDTEIRSSTQSATRSVTASKSSSHSSSLISMCSFIDPYGDATNQTGRYLVSGDAPNSTVTDLWTGLMWEQTTSSSTYFWNSSAPPGSAQAYCAGLRKGGYADWRLPNPQELQGLKDYTMIRNPSINGAVFPATFLSRFWTSIVYSMDTSRSWFIDYGGVSLQLTNTTIGVRCVRANTSEILDRYTTDITQVKDQFTGLIWQRSMPAFSMNQTSAVAYCQEFTLGSMTWRLPTVKELSSLVDYSTENPWINTTVFPDMTTQLGNSQTWSSTPEWYVYFGYGSIYVAMAGSVQPYIVRCVRDSQWSTRAYEDATNQANRYYILGNRSDAVVKDTYTNLMWEQTGPTSPMTWSDAESYCAGLVKQNYGCWRLPTHVELQTLVDYTINCAGPVINTSSFPSTATSYYWSSDLLQGYPGSAWWVSFGNTAYYGGLVCNQGYGGCSSVPATGFARCVRPLSATGMIDRYIFNSTQVLDTVTGLYWQRVVSGTYPWSATAAGGSAQAYCNGLNLDGLAWRLPSAKELSTILDVSVAYPGPTINTTAFLSTPQGGFWSSTPYACFPSIAWVVFFNGGDVYNGAISTGYYVRCAR